ncbi:regulatory protein spx [Pilibacter termitis]|uniref:Regulatory protein spx n=1 Tax=Pilibacter termitis TaxID=263852 RepID=A0A1T4R6H0_9ENTE|nr:transcriptional regulator Spx [Pilibacter termitis]SKA11221.1 regulatory protein spx [Pilibacter termitis]
MLKIFMSPSCTSCRKARQWLIDHEIPYIERNTVRQKVNADELREILMMTENGTEDIISKRSNAYSLIKDRMDDMSVGELIATIEEYPTLLRRPIMIDDKRLQVGYNEDEIRVFLPRKIRRASLQKAQYASAL